MNTAVNNPNSALIVQPVLISNEAASTAHSSNQQSVQKIAQFPQTVLDELKNGSRSMRGPHRVV